ncbi:MAG: hypothetical protein H6656_07885 [Ardenticatenaceae bacterium]|nr:hypothetical protein [Ardenticatenaceae bacterium]
MPAGLSNSLAALNRVSASSGSGLVAQAEGVSMETAVTGIALYTFYLWVWPSSPSGVRI